MHPDTEQIEAVCSCGHLNRIEVAVPDKVPAGTIVACAACARPLGSWSHLKRKALRERPRGAE